MRILVTCVLFLFFSNQSLADPAMWRVKNEQVEITFFGTFHLLRPETVWQTSLMQQQLLSSDTLYLEIDLNTLDQNN